MPYQLQLLLVLFTYGWGCQFSILCVKTFIITLLFLFFGTLTSSKPLSQLLLELQCPLKRLPVVKQVNRVKITHHFIALLLLANLHEVVTCCPKQSLLVLIFYFQFELKGAWSFEHSAQYLLTMKIQLPAVELPHLALVELYPKFPSTEPC